MDPHAWGGGWGLGAPPWAEQLTPRALGEAFLQARPSLATWLWAWSSPLGSLRPSIFIWKLEPTTA